MKRGAAVCLLVLTGSLLYGCGGRAGGNGGFQPESSSVYVSQEGTVSSAIVEAYEGDNYDEESLKAFLEGAIAEYTETHPGQGETPPVSLKSCSVGNGKMTAVFGYGSAEDMIAFAQEQEDDSIGLEALEVKNAGDAFSAGEVAGDFVDGSGQPASLTDVMKEDKAKMIITEGEALIQTGGKILYVSAGTEVDGEKNQAKVAGEKSYIIFK